MDASSSSKQEASLPSVDPAALSSVFFFFSFSLSFHWQSRREGRSGVMSRCETWTRRSGLGTRQME